MTDRVKLWTSVYEDARAHQRPSDITATILMSEREIAFAEASAQAVENFLKKHALPGAVPDPYAMLRDQPTALRAEGTRWQSLRDRIHAETGL